MYMYIDETGIFFSKMNSLRRDKEFKAKVVTGTVNLNETGEHQKEYRVAPLTLIDSVDVSNFYA